MDRDELRSQLARAIGLGGALALLGACGPGGPETAGTETETEAEASADQGQLPPVEPMCTVENFESDPAARDVIELVCTPVPASGQCPPCDEVCAYELATCQANCYDHLVLCSEVVEDQCCHVITAWEYAGGFVPGRPLREAGAPLLPLLIDGASAGVGSSAGARSAAGDGYRELARCEQASVAAFLHCAALLEGLGAPAKLVERHRDAAREEAGHARLALAAATALDGAEVSLGSTPAPRRTLDLRAFVRDLVLDGCIGETAAALEACWALRQDEVAACPALRRFWLAVAREEAGHAALAWASLEFILAARPELAATARAALSTLAELAVADTEATSEPSPDAEALGLASAATRARLLADARALLLAASAGARAGAGPCPAAEVGA